MKQEPVDVIRHAIWFSSDCYGVEEGMLYPVLDVDKAASLVVAMLDDAGYLKKNE